MWLIAATVVLAVAVTTLNPALRLAAAVVVAAVCAAGIAIVLFVGGREEERERQLSARLTDSERLAREAADDARSSWRSVAQLGSALNRMADPVLVLDPQGRVAFANPSLVALAGIHAFGRAVHELFPATDLPRIHQEAMRGETVTEPILIRRGNGPRTWEVSARPLPEWPAEETGDGTAARGTAYTLLTFRDITEAARVLQVRTDFVANASHELRTPIAAIRMALDTLGAVENADAALRARLMTMLGGQVSRLEELARDMLDLSRLESQAEMRIEPVDLWELVDSLRLRFEGVCAERDLTLEFEIAPTPPGAPPIRSDRRLLDQILGNLIENAAKFAFEGTAVRVAATRMPPAPGSDAPGVRLEVIDKGIGIPLDQQQRIFERFYQVDTSRSGLAGGGARRGSGLGLAIVKHAVRLLGGTVRVSSVWQQGTTMTVELPGRCEEMRRSRAEDAR
jgi:two-component system phosphate regulon sensor histidine kinase PhoR